MYLLNDVGKVATYSAIAIAINKPDGYRSISNTLRIGISDAIVPWHRVISCDRKVGGYGFLSDTKIQRLNEECVQFDPDGRVNESYLYSSFDSSKIAPAAEKKPIQITHQSNSISKLKKNNAIVRKYKTKTISNTSKTNNTIPTTYRKSSYKLLHKKACKETLKSSSNHGIIGLKNLGNTCYMNTSLQCLSNTVPLMDYFVGYDWEKEINRQNSIGTGGVLAEAFGHLVKEMWGPLAQAGKSKYKYIIPDAFKQAIGAFRSQFSGNTQEDAQELLSFILDGLHEDLNRVDLNTNINTHAHTNSNGLRVSGSLRESSVENVHQDQMDVCTALDTTLSSVTPSIQGNTTGSTSNPTTDIEEDSTSTSCSNSEDEEIVAIEAWKLHLERNRSIIVDIFQGQLRNSLKCLTCNFESKKFDPLMYLSLPVVSKGPFQDDDNAIDNRPHKRDRNMSIDMSISQSSKNKSHLSDCLKEFCHPEVLSFDCQVNYYLHTILCLMKLITNIFVHTCTTMIFSGTALDVIAPEMQRRPWTFGLPLLY